jgi:hypothetical protein
MGWENVSKTWKNIHVKEIKMVPVKTGRKEKMSRGKNCTPFPTSCYEHLNAIITFKAKIKNKKTDNMQRTHHLNSYKDRQIYHHVFEKVEIRV